LKLIDGLFEVIESSVAEAGFNTTIKLNAGHIVYSGHFPGHPVTPGVIQIQIVHELTEKYFQKKLKLLSMSQCKFLKILNPAEAPVIVIHIEYKRTDELLDIKASGGDGTDVTFKLNADYRFI
jgi:3-hydroxyacyl-[acyl-carrier-protein] dehydratase